MLKIISISILIALNIFAAEINILSWNIFMIPKPVNFSKQIQRAKVIGKKLSVSKYDILLLQEAFSGMARKLIYKDLKAQYPYQYYNKTRKGGKLFGILPSGVWIVSKFPIIKTQTKVFASCTTSDCLADKAVHLYELKIQDGRTIQIANTHLQAWNTEKSVQVREKQLMEIKNLLDENKKDGVAQIIAGDLNVDYFKPIEFQNMLNILGVNESILSGDIKISNGFEVDCFKIPASEIGGEWLDHILLLENNSNAQIKSTQIIPFKGLLRARDCHLSDHYGIEATIKI